MAECAWLFLHPLFCSIDLHTCFCASSILFLLLQICNITLNSGIVVPATFPLLPRIAFAIRGLFWFYANFRIVFSFCETQSWYFDWDSIKSICQFWRMVILTLLVCTYPEQGISFYFLVFSLIFFFLKTTMVFVIEVFHFIIRLIPNHFNFS